MAHADLKELRGLLERATPLPWAINPETNGTEAVAYTSRLPDQGWLVRQAVLRGQWLQPNAIANATLAFAAVNALPTLLDTLSAYEALIGSLFDAIQHGDEDHRAWLKEAIAAHFAGEPVPPSRGSGRKEALIRDMREALEPRPVETAPKDGSYFLFIGTNFDGGMAVVHWDDGMDWWMLDDGKNFEIALRHEAKLTGWLPLPAARKAHGAAKGEK